MAAIKGFSLFVKNEMTDERKVMMNMTKYDLFVFLFSFFLTLEVGMVLVQQA
ncbi:MAG: hypothetical protein WCI97_02875 [Bacteroidota bacterium]